MAAFTKLLQMKNLNATRKNDFRSDKALLFTEAVKALPKFSPLDVGSSD